MQNKKYFLLIITFFLFLSCSSKKNIIYIQDLKNVNDYESVYNDYKIKVDDILKIDVNSKTPDLSSEFNPYLNSTFSSKDVILFNGYQVNSGGFIFFPTLGKIQVLSLTISQIREKIYQMITNSGYLIDPVVDVKIINSHFTILGDVKNPGRYEFLKNNLNVLEAIGMAGDLTINGERKIKVIREFEKTKKIIKIDLTKTDFLKNESFQIYSGDIIIVDPNTSKVKNAGIIGNSGTLINLLSFITTLVIIISNNN